MIGLRCIDQRPTRGPPFGTATLARMPVRHWAKAIVGRAPMGGLEALALLVTFGAAFLGALALPLKATDPTIFRVLWWTVVVGSTLLFLRGAVGLVAVGISALDGAGRAIRRRRRRSVSLLSGALTATVKPGPVSPTLPQHSFSTGGRRNEAHELGHRPQALQFSKPEDRVVRHADIPCRMRCGDGWLVVQNFYALGVVIDEDGTYGDPVAFVSYPSGPAEQPIGPTFAPWGGQFVPDQGSSIEQAMPILPPGPTPPEPAPPEPEARSANDVVRDLNRLYDTGERITGKFAVMSYPYAEGVWWEATTAWRDWVDEIERLFEMDRPRHLIPLREAAFGSIEIPVVELMPTMGTEAPIGANREYRQRTDAIRRLLRGAIDEP